MTYASSVIPDLFYPESDGKPMSDNTRQYRWLVGIKENLEVFLAANLDVFIAGNLMWYPVEGHPEICQAPDVMVIFGRPRGDRGSYQQWKEQGIGPQIAVEILSPNNTKREMAEKRDFYEKYGVEEYYIYDPERFRLTGWIRSGDQLIAIANMENWVSPLLKIRFTQVNGDLEIYRPDGRRFLSSVEFDRLADVERQRADQEQLRADQEQLRADQALQEAAIERERSARMAEYLRSIGVDPTQI
jgi:Uma2 family endonuclease